MHDPCPDESDDARWSALTGADRRRLVRAATRLLGPAEAEDAVQDAYVRALEAGAQPLTAAQAWLLTVVRHLAIDRLRRRHWLQQWLAQADADDTAPAAPPAEMEAALAQETTRALRLLAARLTPQDGAVVLLHEVFEANHAEIAQASGKSEAGSRQQLRRALARLRQPGGAGDMGDLGDMGDAGDSGKEALLHLYRQSLQLRNPQTLWGMLRQPPIHARAGLPLRMSKMEAEDPSATPATTCGIVQVGGQLGLVLALDGVTLCVLPLGVQPEYDEQG